MGTWVMNIDNLISCLKYTDSPYYLSGKRLYEHPGYSHIFRLASEKCDLHGVYALKMPKKNHLLHEVMVPAVYVCEADTEQKAREFHRLVWNQNIVPFLIVLTPKTIRLYPGFNFDPRLSEDKNQSILEVAKKTSEVLKRLSDFTSDSINKGDLWTNWDKKIPQNTRVDRKLLGSLNSLSEWLCHNGLPRNTAHAVIGKFVYLHYLRNRKILSDRKLEQWAIDKESIFSRNATLDGFYAVTDRLEEWLNGVLFPISKKGASAPELRHIQKVASVFHGDDPESGQLSLDFKAYNFEYIPIETLSIVYQQFLHVEGKGRGRGAYYTPIHLVNYILDELDSKRPFQKGIKALDPACGSGAFLVQCYRRLVEREQAKNPGKQLQPSELRYLMTNHIYGMDVDEDACGITELSLILTLLDYVDPPDLEKPGYKKFKLPALRNRNIFCCKDGFFKPNSEWEENKPENGFDWIVGNPPWKQLKANKLEKGDRSALDWIKKNKDQFPTSDNQIAEAFAWEVTQHLSKHGMAGLLLPAVTLFKTHATKFRQQFFDRMDVWCIVNFSNLRHLIFQDATSPAAAFFYSIWQKDNNCSAHHIVTFAPFAVHQLSRYEGDNRQGKKLWTIIVNADEIREISHIDASSGSNLPWKLAMWGSVRDKRLLNSLQKRYPSFSEFKAQHRLIIHQGIVLRTKYAKEPVEPLAEIEGKPELDMSVLSKCGRIFAFPKEALKPVEASRAYVRKGRGKIPLKACYPPHIIVDAARRFAVFSDEFIVVPHRQIGIAGSPRDNSLLKALALYFASDFFIYHQFLSSPILGIERDRANNSDIENLPIPLDDLSSHELSEWVSLHDELIRATPSELRNTLFNTHQERIDISPLLKQLNERVYALMGINQNERWLIQDLLHVRKNLNEGRIAKEATMPADEKEMLEYANVLKAELDSFLDGDIKDQHRITVFYSNDLTITKIEHLRKLPAGPVSVVRVEDQDTKNEFKRIRESLLRKQGQWIYFNRNLKLFEGRITYFAKPLQRLSWLKSQAFIDADEFIAEKLTMTGDTN
jgi:hypothetical protein